MEMTDLNEQELNRRAALQQLKDLGIDPYPAEEFPVNATSKKRLRRAMMQTKAISMTYPSQGG